MIVFARLYMIEMKDGVRCCLPEVPRKADIPNRKRGHRRKQGRQRDHGGYSVVSCAFVASHDRVYIDSLLRVFIAVVTTRWSRQTVPEAGTPVDGARVSFV
jgi:hypothetical protein